MVRLCHHYRTTPDVVRTWPLPFVAEALRMIEVGGDG